MTHEEFLRELDLRAELVAARLALAHWERRVAELESGLPEASPLRRAAEDPQSCDGRAARLRDSL